MADFFYKVVVEWTVNNLAGIVNTYALRHTAAAQDADAVLLSNIGAWLTSVYSTSAMTALMNTGVVYAQGRVTEVTAGGVAIRLVGALTPAGLSGTIGGDSEPAIVAASSSPRTGVARVKSGKRWPTFVDSVYIGQIMTNTPLAFVTAATVRWMGGVFVSGVLRYVAGVFSTKTGGFLPLTGTATIKNFPSSQATRKVGRGL